MRATCKDRKMSVVETSVHPSVVIVADGELARKGFEYYARAAGIRVGPFGAPAKREGLAQTVAGHADLHLIGTASSVERIEWRAPAAADSLVVLDLNLPGKSGAAAVAYVVQTGARVVVVSAQESRDTVLDALVLQG